MCYNCLCVEIEYSLLHFSIFFYRNVRKTLLTNRASSVWILSLILELKLVLLLLYWKIQIGK